MSGADGTDWRKAPACGWLQRKASRGIVSRKTISMVDEALHGEERNAAEAEMEDEKFKARKRAFEKRAKRKAKMKRKVRAL